MNSERPSLRAHSALLALAASGLVGCADTVRPVMGGLKIGAAASPFQMPALETEEMPFRYPRDAWESGIGGETMLKIHIGTSGWVDSVEVARSSGHTSLDSAAVVGALLLRYRPARHGDTPVAVWGYLPVKYPMPERVNAGDGGRR